MLKMLRFKPKFPVCQKGNSSDAKNAKFRKAEYEVEIAITFLSQYRSRSCFQSQL